MALLRILSAWALAITSAGAFAQGSFTVSPLRVDLTPKATAGVIEVLNTSDGAMTLQVQQRDWKQEEGRDIQSETRDLILSPAIFTLQRGEKQIVRIALRGAPDTQRERAYRIFVSEVPAPQIKAAPNASGFRVALRMDLPLFVAPLPAGAPQPSYALDANDARLFVRNAGNAHIRYTDFTVLQAGRKVAELPIFTVLAGSERRFELPRDRLGAGGGVRVQANSNAGPIDAAVADAR
jgi:fimbrial chaperone protein